MSDDAGAQAFFAAKQVRTSADVEHQPVRRIERDEWRIAIAMQSQPVEQFSIGAFVQFGDGDIRNARACIRQR